MARGRQLDLLDGRARDEEIRNRVAMWRFRFALAWREIGDAAHELILDLQLKYPTTCKQCEGSVCPECDPKEVEEYCQRNWDCFGVHDDPNRLESDRRFRLWLKYGADSELNGASSPIERRIPKWI